VSLIGERNVLKVYGTGKLRAWSGRAKERWTVKVKNKTHMMTCCV